MINTIQPHTNGKCHGANLSRNTMMNDFCAKRFYLHIDLCLFHYMSLFQKELSWPLLRKCVIVKMVAIVPIGMTHTPVCVPWCTLAESVKTVSNLKLFGSCFDKTLHNCKLRDLFSFFGSFFILQWTCFSMLLHFIKASDVYGKK